MLGGHADGTLQQPLPNYSQNCFGTDIRDPLHVQAIAVSSDPLSKNPSDSRLKES